VRPVGDPRRPALPISIDEDPEHVLIQEDGTVRRHHEFTYSAEDLDRIRTGYCCIHCGESQVDHGAPFPDHCWVCKFPMRERQQQRFAQEFVGEKKVGPSTTIEEEMAIARDHVEREMHKPGSSIIVPRIPILHPGQHH
jgi:hypothetical protein